jgi:transposase
MSAASVEGQMARSKVELFEAIRRDHRREGLSIRGLADRYSVHRRTVRQALESPVPPARKTPDRPAPKLDPVKELIDAMLREDLEAPRKQRHTARRVRARLIDEHDVEVSYSTVRDYVARRRPEIWAEAGRSLSEVFVPQFHEPAAEGEVDFADLWIVLAGVKTKVFLFTLRMSYSGRAAHRAFATASQEAFLEGHVHAFNRLGGVPVLRIRYDNLKAAVSRVLFGRNRIESGRWVTFRSYYGFDAFYCRPGIEGAHEKGGVEGEGGRFRRNHLVPMPRVESIAELNELLERYDDADDGRRIEHRTNTVGDDFALEAPLLTPLPAEAFETGITLTPRVDRSARITVRQSRYSVPAKLIGRRLRVLLRATEVLAFDGPRLVARHERCTTRGGEVLVLDHYLEILARKPGAMPGATALAQARSAGTFTATHEAFWAAARTKLGDAGGTRALIGVQLLHRNYPATAVLAGITAALTVGSVDPDVVAVEVRRTAASTTGAAVGHDGAVAGRVIPRPDGPATPTVLPPDDRPVPDVARYDELLHRRTPTPTHEPIEGEAIS